MSLMLVQAGFISNEPGSSRGAVASQNRTLEDFAILVDKHLSSDYRNLLCLTAVLWMYQMAENKAVTGQEL